MTQIINSNDRTARKEHQCQWCGGKIEIGEVYRDDTVENCGNVYGWKSHIRCEKVFHEAKMYDYDGDGVDGDQFAEMLREYIHEMETSELSKMLYEYTCKKRQNIKLFNEIKNYIEETEVRIDGEWGSGRTLKELKNEMQMPRIYDEVCVEIYLLKKEGINEE